MRDARADRLIIWLREKASQHPEWSEVSLIDYGRAQMTDLSCVVGALFFDPIERKVGPAVFREVFRDDYALDASSGGTTEQPKALIREHTDDRIEPLLQDWIYTPTWVDRLQGVDSIGTLAGVDAGG